VITDVFMSLSLTEIFELLITLNVACKEIGAEEPKISLYLTG
jgi:hypothetical protein